MKKQKAFTLVELLVVIAIIAVLMGILMPALNRVKELGKRAVCMSNIKNLLTGWNMYAENNNEKICSANPGGGGGFGASGPGWVGGMTSRSDETALETLSRGAIWPHVNSVDAYKCPTGFPGEICTYSITDAMNGAQAGLNAEGLAKNGVYIRNRLDIKRPAERLLFVDEGYAAGASFTVWYYEEQWWDEPPTRHSNGTTWGYADSHADYKGWMSANTIMIGETRATLGPEGGNSQPYRDRVPEDQEEFEDLHWLQKGTWGEFGYEPTTSF